MGYIHSIFLLLAFREKNKVSQWIVVKMKKRTIKSLMASLLLFSASSVVNATIYTTLFTNASAVDSTAGGNLGLSFLSGAPTGTFASLSYNSVTNVFILSAASNLDSYFGANTFIDAIALNTMQSRAEINDENVSGGGIFDLVESTNEVPDFGADSADDFHILYRAGNGTELVQGEAMTFTIAGLNPNCFTSIKCEQNNQPLFASAFALRVTNNPSGNSNTAISWYSGASIDPALAVPEPSSYAMLLAGLGVLGFVFRRCERENIS